MGAHPVIQHPADSHSVLLAVRPSRWRDPQLPDCHRGPIQLAMGHITQLHLNVHNPDICTTSLSTIPYLKISCCAHGQGQDKGAVQSVGN